MAKDDWGLLTLLATLGLGFYLGWLSHHSLDKPKPSVAKALDLKFYTNGGEFRVRCADVGNQATCELNGGTNGRR